MNAPDHLISGLSSDALLYRPLAEVEVIDLQGEPAWRVTSDTSFCVRPGDGAVLWLPGGSARDGWLPPIHANQSLHQFVACERAVATLLRTCPTPRLPDGRVDGLHDLDVYEAVGAQIRAAVSAIDDSTTSDSYWSELYWDVIQGDWAEVGYGP